MDRSFAPRKKMEGASFEINLAKSVLAILAAALCAFLPVREAALCGRLRDEIAASRRQIKARRDAMALLEAEIAQAGTPEFIFWLAGSLGAELFRIDPRGGLDAQEAQNGGAL